MCVGRSCVWGSQGWARTQVAIASGCSRAWGGQGEAGHVEERLHETLLPCRSYISLLKKIKISVDQNQLWQAERWKRAGDQHCYVWVPSLLPTEVTAVLQCPCAQGGHAKR